MYGKVGHIRETSTVYMHHAGTTRSSYFLMVSRYSISEPVICYRPYYPLTYRIYAYS